MDPNTVETGLSEALHLRAGERRKNPRFDMRFPVFLHALGEPWAMSETSDVSAAGAFFVSERPFLLNTPIEYVLTFPMELTKASRPLRVRFYGTVLRCERVPGVGPLFGIAVRNTAHRYLTSEEAAGFNSLEQRRIPAASTRGATPEANTGT
ncbi:MAG TPA: PilZ domain-containing protein [Candidatus Bathyarchaeia archaeon]|nr:PilZ domain-containing protein [Candidatus Bathyarchaeia archaeon]